MKTVFSALTSALTGVQKNLHALDRSAHRIATATPGEPIALADELVAALIARHALEASASSLRRVDDAIRSITDAFD